jgi:hypothetical protein
MRARVSEFQENPKSRIRSVHEQILRISVDCELSS